jgi:hypothetical protein
MKRWYIWAIDKAIWMKNRGYNGKEQIINNFEKQSKQ